MRAFERLVVRFVRYALLGPRRQNFITYSIWLLVMIGSSCLFVLSTIEVARGFTALGSALLSVATR